MIKDSINDILGSRIESSFQQNDIKRNYVGLDKVNGVFDLLLNNYGPDKYGSVHVELPDTMNADEVDYISRD